MFLFAPEQWTNKIQLAFAYTFHQPLATGRNLSLSVTTPWAVADGVSRDQYNKLQNHLANVIGWLDLEHQKVAKLSGLRDRSVWQGVNFVLADVITTSIGSSHARLIIDRGQNDGLAEDQFVLADYSIIGTISDVDSRTAQVRLITDPASKIAVKTAQDSQSNMVGTPFSNSPPDGASMIMQGSGNETAKIRLLPTKHEIKVGDIVYAERKPGFLGTPMITARVTQCKRDDANPLLWDVTVKPACEVEKLKDVTIIVMNPQE